MGKFLAAAWKGTVGFGLAVAYPICLPHCATNARIRELTRTVFAPAYTGVVGCLAFNMVRAGLERSALESLNDALFWGATYGVAGGVISRVLVGNRV